MTRRKTLTVVFSLIGVFGLMFALLLISTPVPAVSHASYAWTPGCHCDGSSDPGASDPSAAVRDAGDGSQMNAKAGGPPHYYLSPVAIALLFAYGVSFALYRTKRMRVATHRKIWNVMLLATFLLCGLIGLVLAVGVARNPPLELPTWLLVWHVEMGIAMCFISLFHVGWHLKYYLAMVTGKRRNERTKRAPAVEKQRAARPPVRRRLIPRTDAQPAQFRRTR